MTDQWLMLQIKNLRPGLPQAAPQAIRTQPYTPGQWQAERFIQTSCENGPMPALI